MPPRINRGWPENMGKKTPGYTHDAWLKNPFRNEKNAIKGIILGCIRSKEG